MARVWFGAACFGVIVSACVGDAATNTPTPDAGGDTSAPQDSGKDTAVATESGVDAGVCPGMTNCGGDGGANKCVDLATDKDNCGTCNHICPSKACENGDCVMRVFVSSAMVSGGASGSALAFDTQCQNLATGAALDGKYKAWVSDDSTSPSARFTQSKASYQRMDGTKIAASWTNLTSGTIAVAINRDEKNTVLGGTPLVWTDTDTDGTELKTGANCTNWTKTTGSGSYGDGTASDAKWTNSSSGACSNGNFHFYCFEQ